MPGNRLCSLLGTVASVLRRRSALVGAPSPVAVSCLHGFSLHFFMFFIEERSQMDHETLQCVDEEVVGDDL